MRPNFCCRECAGRAWVSIRSGWRRIAERFRWLAKHALVCLPTIGFGERLGLPKTARTSSHVYGVLGVRSARRNMRVFKLTSFSRFAHRGLTAPLLNCLR